MYLHHIRESTRSIMVTCPFHKDHRENRPSCGVFLEDRGNFKAGDFHCFTCGETGNLAKLVGKCLGGTEETGKQWLLNSYCDVLLQRPFYLPKIELGTESSSSPTFLSEDLIKPFLGYHSYMEKRHISREVAEKFDLGYNPENNSIIFPLRDEKGNLVGTSSRNISQKLFNIDIINVAKPVYLLHNIIKEGYSSVIVCESQIDALAAWSYGYAACAMIGTGTDEQHRVLNKSPIRHYILMFDNDSAGKSAAARFMSHIRKDVFVDIVRFPSNKKDINDFSYDEFKQLLVDAGFEVELKIKCK